MQNGKRVPADSIVVRAEDLTRCLKVQIDNTVYYFGHIRGLTTAGVFPLRDIDTGKLNTAKALVAAKAAVRLLAINEGHLTVIAVKKHEMTRIIKEAQTIAERQRNEDIFGDGTEPLIVI